MSTLLVPIRVDALRLLEDLHGVLTPLADFHELPWVRGKAGGKPRDVHPDIAFTSQNVLADPFSDTFGVLERGIHLHWALPAALSVGRHPRDADGKPEQHKVEFPAVPNRWLVVRTDGASKRRWVVESDYLWPEGAPWAPGRVTYPAAKERRRGAGEEAHPLDANRQPYRYLGRTWAAEAWSESTSEEEREHLEKLVAIGYGEPTFAAFYPNCRGVFGLHDDGQDDARMLDADVPVGLTYEVFGWYSSAEADLLHQLRGEWSGLVQRLREEWKKSGVDAADFDERERERLERAAGRDLGWMWEPTPSAGQPDRILCYGKLSFAEDADETAAPSSEHGIEISIGNSGTEALSAWLAEEVAAVEVARHPLAEGKRVDSVLRRVEHQLEALHLTDATHGQRLDLGPKFKEARHDKSFHSFPGGTLWTLRPRAEGGPAGPASARARRQALKELADEHAAADAAAHESDAGGDLAALPPEAAHALHEINQLQGRFDRAQAEIASLRRLIFAEWHKYITCCYRPDFVRFAYPELDQVKRHVEGLVALLDVKLIYAGQLERKQHEDRAARERDLEGKLARLAEHGLTRMTTPLVPATDGGFQSWCEHMQHDAGGFKSLAEQLAERVGLLSSTLAVLGPVGVAARALVQLVGTLASSARSGKSARSSEKQESELLALSKTLHLRSGELAQHAKLLPAMKLPDYAATSARCEAVRVELQELVSTAKDVPGEKLTELGRELASLASRPAALPDLELAPTPAPRYWQPNDPVLLLAGPGVQRSDRHAADRKLACKVLESFDLDAFTKAPASERDEQLGRQLPTAESSLRKTKGDPWHPLFIEWEVGLEPRDGNVPPSRRAYPKDFVTRHYSLRERRTEFLASDGLDVSLTPSASYPSGRSVLTPQAGTLLGRRIDDYIAQQVRLYLHAQGAVRKLDAEEQALLSPAEQSPEERVQLCTTYLARHGVRKKLEAWCDEVYRQGLVDAFVHAPDLGRSDPSPVEQARAELRKQPPEPAERLAFFHEHEARILEWFNERVPDSAQPDAPIHTVFAAQDKLEEHADTIQSQALGGFHEALLMGQEVLQFDPLDPLGFPEYREFTERVVRAAVAGHAHTAPLPHFDFHPIRTGELRLARTRLVDTFGRPTKDLTTRLHATQQLHSPRERHASLPPRITQPARVDFRWISALDDALESNPHPLTSPVCGWLVPNNLDTSLMVYDRAGALLGDIDQAGRWRTAPGRSGPTLTSDIDDAHLSRMVTWLVEKGRAEERFIADFLDVLDSALENIDPEGFEGHEAQALLLGRPLALVRAAVDLELLGLPACDHSWDALHQALAGHELDTDNFLEVDFPVRIGEHMQLGDGVAGFWVDAGEGYLEDRFFAPQSEWTPRLEGEKNLVIHHTAGQPLNFLHSLGDPPTRVTMLIDPRGAAHCTTGVLPTKSLRIPREHYAEALRSLRATFLTSPILTSPGRTEIPLPTEPGWSWSWVQRDDAGWTERTTRVVVERDEFIAAAGDGMTVWLALFECGWLRAPDEAKSSALVLAVGERSAHPLPKQLEPRQAEIEATLARVVDAEGKCARRDFFEAFAHGELVWSGLLASRWLEPVPGTGARALLVPPDGRAALPDELNQRKAEVQRLLDMLGHSLAPARLEARFGPTAEIREGWLQLRPED